jgi:hypothetical protein
MILFGWSLMGGSLLGRKEWASGRALGAALIRMAIRFLHRAAVAINSFLARPEKKGAFERLLPRTLGA